MRNIKQRLVGLITALTIVTTSGLAADIFFEGRYVNQRYGYVLELPGGFALTGLDEARGEGAQFAYPDVNAELQVWGGKVDRNPRDDLEDIRTTEMEAGWALDRTVYGPDGVTIEGRRGNRHVDLRYINMCDGNTYALYRLEYDADDYPNFAFVRNKLETSFGAAPDQRCR